MEPTRPPRPLSRLVVQQQRNSYHAAQEDPHSPAAASGATNHDENRVTPSTWVTTVTARRLEV